MSICRSCGAEISFRVIQGRTVPLGCRCDEDCGYYHDRDEQTRWTSCPVCGGGVYFVEYNGGCVWLDALGPPWPKHGCFDDQTKPVDRKPQRVAFAGGEVTERGKIMKDRLTSDLGQRFMLVSFPNRVVELYVPPAFWERDVPPQTGDSVGWDGDGKEIVRDDGKHFACWVVDLKRCGHCGKFFVAWEGHRDLCKRYQGRSFFPWT